MEKKKPKILFILHIPPPINGAAMVGKFILDSHLINETFTCDSINLTTSFNLRGIGKGSVTKIFTVLRIITRTATALLKKKYDLCYITLTAKGTGFYKDFLIVLLLKLFGKKIIFHFHNKGVRENSSNAIKRGLYRFVFKNTQSILLAPQLYLDISDYVKESDVYFCANGMPDIIKDLAVRNIASNSQSPCKFLFLSNMMRQKGVFVVLDACSVLNKMGILFECHFVGAWSDISESEFNNTVVKNGLNGKVYAHGAKYGAEKLQFFKDSDVFLFPTFYHNEAFPLVNLEAMQQGLPVISTPEGGIPEMVSQGETGFLVPQGNVEELVETMKVFIQKPALISTMGLAGRRLYENRFTLLKFENRMKGILKNAIVSGQHR